MHDEPCFDLGLSVNSGGTIALFLTHASNCIIFSESYFFTASNVFSIKLLQYNVYSFLGLYEWSICMVKHIGWA